MTAPSVWCVRANYGQYADRFVAGGYAAIGWGLPDLSSATSRQEIDRLYRATYPDETSAAVIGQQVGQIARFRLEIRPEDIVITPGRDTDLLFWGDVQENPYFFAPIDDCPFRHRLKVRWAAEPVRRSTLSVPLQSSLRSALSVFAVAPPDELLRAIGRLASMARPAVPDPQHVVIDRLLLLDAREFELLVGHLLSAIGFEDMEVTGKPGDGGVDATGELNVSNLARIRLFVQAKRYKPGTTVSARTVRDLRAAIPRDGQGAFVTTATFDRGAREIAEDPMFPRIGLIDGRQLVDLLVAHWDRIPEEFRTKLGLRPGLVLTAS